MELPPPSDHGRWKLDSGADAKARMRISEIATDNRAKRNGRLSVIILLLSIIL